MLLGFLSVALLWLGVGLHIAQEREAVLAGVLLNTSNLARVVEEHAVRAVKELDETLLLVRNAYERDPSGFDIVTRSGNRYFTRDLTLQVSIIGPDGKLRLSNLGPADPVDLSDREHFRHHLAETGDELFISKPLLGRQSKAWSVQLSRRIRAPDGGFGGVVVASMDPHYLARFYTSVDVGARGTVMLLGTDGIVRGQQEDDPGDIGDSWAGTPLMEAIARRPVGSFIGDPAPDHVRRIYYYRTLPEFPLIVVIGVSEDDIMAPYLVNKQRYLIAAALLPAIILFLAVLADRHRRAMRRKSSELEATLEHMGQGILMADARGRVAVVNRRAVEMLDLPEGVVRRGADFATITAQQEVRGDFRGRAAMLDAGGREVVLPPGREGLPPLYERTRPDGMVIEVRTTALGDGGFVRTYTDRTIRKRIEAALAERNAILEATFNSIGWAIAAFQNGRLVAWNRHFVEIFGVPGDLARVATPVRALEALDRQREEGLLVDLSEQAERARAAQQALVIERRRPNGATFELSYSPGSHGPAASFVFSAADVTVRRRTESFLREAQKMEALGKMTGGIAHDFNNLLTVVIINLEYMQRDEVITARHGRRIDLTVNAAQRGATLVRQLLAFARKQPLEPEVINLAVLMPGLVELVQRAVGEAIHVESVSCAGPWNALLDAAQFESAVLNLALNARDAMAETGKLTIELANTVLDEAYAAQHADVTPGQYVMVAVSDTGAGMPPAVLARAFDPFFTTKPEGKGTGLGLSMVYGFVKQTGGHVKIYSEPGHGTTVKLYFPRCYEGVVQDRVDRRQPVATGHETILVVEDDEGLRATVVAILSDLGYTVLEAAEGAAALALLREGRHVDLLFTDVILPGAMSGRDLAERAAALRPGLKVLFTSGYTENSIIHHGRLDPGISLLSKPYRRDQIAEKLRRVLTGSSIPG